MLKHLVFALAMLTSIQAYTQNTPLLADSVRKAFYIPALSYAVLSADSVYELRAFGVKERNTNDKATLDNRYRIGSNTKAITGYLATMLVKQGKIKWDTKFFDLYPELKAASGKEYHDLTLRDLLTFRTKLFPYTYTDKLPLTSQFTGNEDEQRYQFAQWFLKHTPVKKKDSVCFSNLGYVAAGMMLEKATGKPFKQLVTELGKELDIEFGFGQPNANNPSQIWGHNAALVPEAPADNHKLNWLLAAGNINVTLPDYIKYIQIQLKGLNGQSTLMSKEEFRYMHYGRERFALGWFWGIDDQNRLFSYNIGNPGTFLSKVYVYGDQNRAFIIFTNAQTEDCDTGTEILLARLIAKYTY